MSAYITSIGTANPHCKISQQEVLTFMKRAHNLSIEEARELDILYRATGIQTRFSVIEDYRRTKDFTFFPDNDTLSPFPGTKERGLIYKQEAMNISKEAAENCLSRTGLNKSELTHIITVSCTGLYAPGLDIELVNALGLEKSIQRTAINFMGCYAAFNAFKLAHAICNAQKANVLVVCTELCSLHFQKEKTDDNILANALFGDGSGAVLIQSENPGGIVLKIDSFYCDLLPNGGQAMAWEVGDTGFEMKLSAYVPDVIRTGIHDLLKKLAEKLHDLNFDYYAIHPGGKKILRVLEEALNITKDQNRYAHEVLRNFGNMSSSTILFVLKAVFDDLDPQDGGKKILSFAFGPGLTLESMLLTIIND